MMSDVKVTDEDGLLSRSMMIKANNTIMKERIWINRVASKIVFQFGIQTMALRYTMSVCGYSLRETQLHLEPFQRDVTDMKRSGEWLNMEPRNLVFDSLCVNLFQGVRDCTSECPRSQAGTGKSTDIEIRDVVGKRIGAVHDRLQWV